LKSQKIAESAGAPIGWYCNAPFSQEFWVGAALAQYGLKMKNGPRTRMSRMAKISMWWLFFAIFGLSIGSIQALGWSTRPAAAQGHGAPCKGADDLTTAALRHRNCEMNHWRSVFMQP
jgi:hypothetical protein